MKDSKDVLKDFPARFVFFMEHFGLNPNKLADELNDSSKVKFHRYKIGAAAPHFETLVAISEKYGVSLDWLMRGTGSMITGQPELVPERPAPPKSTGIQESDVQKAVELAKLQVENEQLKEKLEMLKGQVEELRIEKSALFAQLFPYDPSDPNSNTLGHKRQNMLRAGKLWGSDDATDLSVAEIMEREEQKRSLIGFGREKYETPKKAGSFLTVTRGAIVFTKDKFALLAQA